ncbi:MAG: hypothetical protein ACE5FD_16355 [Anaerolineae bacterium]
MPTKILLRWNIRPETESEYFEFLVHEFIPGLSKLGINEIQVWYTAFGSCEQKMATGITETAEQMRQVLRSDRWVGLSDKLSDFVDDYSQKIVQATGGFQI